MAQPSRVIPYGNPRRAKKSMRRTEPTFSRDVKETATIQLRTGGGHLGEDFEQLARFKADALRIGLEATLDLGELALQPLQLAVASVHAIAQLRFACWCISHTVLGDVEQLLVSLFPLLFTACDNSLQLLFSSLRSSRTESMAPCTSTAKALNMRDETAWVRQK